MRVTCGLPQRMASMPAARCTQSRPTAMQKSFLGTQLQPARFASTSVIFAPQQPMRRNRGAVIVEANNKRCIGDTAFGTRRARTRTSGYRARKLTPGGRRVLRARRKKGRKTLCPANSNRGNKSTNAGNRR